MPFISRKAESCGGCARNFTACSTENVFCDRFRRHAGYSLIGSTTISSYDEEQRMIRFCYGLSLVVAVSLAGEPALSPAADPPKSAAEARDEAQAQDVELLAEVYRLAEFAEKHKAPEAYITAGAMALKLKASTKGQIGQLDIKPEVLGEDG